jgi:hypothetical protein
VRSALIGVGGASASLIQDIYRVTPIQTLGDHLFSFRTHIACAQVAGGAARMPQSLRARLKSLITSADKATKTLKEAG